MALPSKLASGLIHTRNVAAVEAAAPTGDAGADVSGWDQALVVVSGTPAGLADFQVWHRVGGFENPTDPADIWVPDVLVQGVPIAAPNAAGFSGAMWVVDTPRTDHLQVLLRALTTTTNAWIKIYGLTPTGKDRVPSTPSMQPVSVVNDITIATGQRVIVTDGTNDAAVNASGGLEVTGDVAHDGADAGNPLKVGGRASTTEPAAVANGDRVNAYFDATGYQLTKPQGQAAENDAVVGNPLLTGGRYDAVDRTLNTGDVGAQALDVAGRTKVVGAAAENDAVVGDPLLIAGRYDAVARALNTGDVGALALDVGGRPQVVGPVADFGTSLGVPVVIGGVFNMTPQVAAANDLISMAVDALGRQIAVGAAAENDAVAGNPLLSGGRYDATARTLNDGDAGAVALDVAGRQLVVTGEGFEPVDGGQEGSGADFTAAAAQRTTQMTVGTLYHLSATADCFIAAGGNTVTATTGDYFLKATDPPLHYRPTTGRDYISAIAPAGGANGKLYASQAE